MLLSLRGKDSNIIVIMLYNGAFVSLVMHCSNRVVSKNISNAGKSGSSGAWRRFPRQKPCLGQEGCGGQMEHSEGSGAGQSGCAAKVPPEAGH